MNQCETELHAFVQSFFAPGSIDAHRSKRSIAETAVGFPSGIWDIMSLRGHMPADKAEGLGVRVAFSGCSARRATVKWGCTSPVQSFLTPPLLKTEEIAAMILRRTCTLLELVQTVTESARNDEEVVATIAYLINSGRVRLCGTFAGAKIAVRPPFPSSLTWRDVSSYGEATLD